MSFDVDVEITDSVGKCATSPAEEFWTNVALYEKYRNIGRLVKAMLCYLSANSVGGLNV